MCGIAGQIKFSRQIEDTGTVRRMANALAHRGPDGDGFWNDAHAALGHRRLAIRDLSEFGRQPMFSEDNTIAMVFNGQIYNDHELKETLTRECGVTFKGHCDAELLVPGFKAWGLGLFSRLEGIFAIALWDARQKTLYLARDAAGVKPLFVYEKGEELFFASEIKGILAAVDEATLPLSSTRLATFFAQGYVGPEETFYRDIRQVRPGTVETISPAEHRVTSFWIPERLTRPRDLKSAAEEFLELFSAVCHDQLVSDVPVGILQSGGVDSSLVAMTLRDTPRPLFTARMSQGDYDETPFAMQIAAATGHPQHEVDGGLGDHVEEDFRAVVHHFDGHVADASALSVYRLARVVRKHVTVALSGDGADEHFAGYPTYAVSQMTARFGKIIPSGLSLSAAEFFSGLDKGQDEFRYPASQLMARMLAALPSGIRAHSRFRRYAMPWDVKKLFAPSLAQPANDMFAGYDLALEKPGTILDRCLLADQSYYLPGDMLWKVDAMSMAHGLEVRVPFLDRRIMQFAATLDAEMLGGGRHPPKRLLRKALQTLGAPPALTQRPKAGFSVPVSSLLRGPLRKLAEKIFVANADGFAPYLHPAAVRSFWQEHVQKQRNHGYLLWAMLTFGVWKKLG